MGTPCAQGLERKLTGLDARAGYQPFSATHGPGGGFDTGGEDANPDPPDPPPAKKVKNLYESFVSQRDREERGLGTERTGGKAADGPRTGNTIHVFGYNITEEIIRVVIESTFILHPKTHPIHAVWSKWDSLNGTISKF